MILIAGGGLTLPDFKTYYKDIVNLTVNYIDIERERYWRKNRQIDQWNLIKSLEMNSPKYSQLIFDK